MINRDSGDPATDPPGWCLPWLSVLLLAAVALWKVAR